MSNIFSDDEDLSDCREYRRPKLKKASRAFWNCNTELERQANAILRKAKKKNISSDFARK